MDAQKMSVDHRRKLSHPKAKKRCILHHPSLSVSHINRSILSRRQHSLPIQHFITNDIQSNDIIHVNIGISKDTINPLNKKLSIQNIHLRSASHHLKLSKNKVKPVDVLKIHRHNQAVEKPSNSPFKDDPSYGQIQNPNIFLSTNRSMNSSEITIDDQRLSVISSDSNQFSDNTNQKKLSITCEKTITNNSTHKFAQQKLSKGRRCRRSFLCAALIPLIVFLLIGCIAALLVAFIKPKYVTSPGTTATDSTNTSATIAVLSTISTTFADTATTYTATSLLASAVTTFIVTVNASASVYAISTITTTVSTISNTSTTLSTTSTTSTAGSTTSSISTTAPTTSTTSTTASTTSSTSTTASTTSSTSTTASTTSSTSTTASTTSTTTSTAGSTTSSISTTASTTSSTSTTASTTSTTTSTAGSTTSSTSTTTSTTSTTSTTTSTTSTTSTTASTISSTSTAGSTTSSISTTASTTSSTSTTASTTFTTITNETTTTTSTTSITTTTASTTSTATTTATTTTTTASLINPCSNGIYWNINGVTYAGTGSSGSALNRLSSPTGIFIDLNDTLYISDSGNYRVVSYLLNATNGTMVAGTGQSGTTLDRFSGTLRLSYVDGSGNIYVADRNNDRVMRWTSGSSAGVMVAGNGSSGTSLNQLDYPCGVWVDSNSNVFVTEINNYRVTKWLPNASAGILIAGTGISGTTTNKLSSPVGLYYDEVNQNLYIVDSGSSDAVIKWRVGDSNGTTVGGLRGSSGSNSNQLNSPTGITLDQWQNIYVVDRTNKRIQLFCNGTSTGITIAGNATGGSNFNDPFDVKVDSQLNLYVADYGGHRVIKVVKL